MSNSTQDKLYDYGVIAAHEITNSNAEQIYRLIKKGTSTETINQVISQAKRNGGNFNQALTSRMSVYF